MGCGLSRLENRLWLVRNGSSGADEDLAQLLRLGRRDNHLEKEPVHLRLGQRVRAFKFDRVLSRQHEKRRRKMVSRAKDGYLAFLHRLQLRRLSFRRGAIDLVS